MSTKELIPVAHHILNGRLSRRDRHLALLADAGIASDRESLTKWVAGAERDQERAEGFWFRGWSARTGNGVCADLPVFGKFGCRIDSAKPIAEEGDEGWSYRFYGSLGISGGMYETEEESLKAALSTLRREGFSPNWQDAAAVAESQAKSRHEQKMAESAGYRKLFETASASI